MVSRNVKFTLFVVSGLKREKCCCIPLKSTQHVTTNGNNAKVMCGSMFIFFSVFLLFPVSSFFPVETCQMRSKAAVCYTCCRLALLYCHKSFTINCHWTLDLMSVKMAVTLCQVTCIDNPPLGSGSELCAQCRLLGERGLADKWPESIQTWAMSHVTLGYHG